MSRDEQAIRNLIATWHEATAAGDVERILPLMDEDVVFLVAGQAPMRGRSGFEMGLRSILKTHRIVSASKVEEIEVSGNLAYAWTSLEVEILALAGGPAMKRTGNTLSIFRRAADGQWVMLRDANMLAAAKVGG